MNLNEAVLKWIIVFVSTFVDFCLAKICSIVSSWSYRLLMLIYDDNQIYAKFPNLAYIESRSRWWLDATWYDLGELSRWFDRKPPIGQMVDGGWELVALARYSQNVKYAHISLQRTQCCPATICDFNSLDDEFWPDRVSIVYNVEVQYKRFAVSVRRYIIWRVSLLSGVRTNVHEFDLETRAWNRMPTDCFQSNGVVLFFVDRWLYVYDIRYKRSKKVEKPFSDRLIDISELAPIGVVSISCLRRLWNVDGRLEGWRIRIVEARFERATSDNFYRARLTDRIFDLRQNAERVGGQEIAFGNWSDVFYLSAKFVHSSNGSFGVHVGVNDQLYNEDYDGGDGPTMFYNRDTNCYVYRADIGELRRDEKIVFGDSFWKSWRTRVERLRPIFLNDRQCVKCFDDGRIVRREFAASSLKFISVEKLFRSRLTLRQEINGDQFRMATGVNGMEAHFDR